MGTYDPLRKPAGIEVNSDSVLKWLSQGAQPTDTVRRIFAKTGVWAHWRAVQNKQAELGEMTGRVTGEIERDRPPRPSKKVAAKVEQEAEAAPPAEETPAAEAAPEEAAPEEAAGDEAAEQKKEAGGDDDGGSDGGDDGTVTAEASEEKNG